MGAVKVYQLVDWMVALNLRVTHVDVEPSTLDDEETTYEKLRANNNTLILELRSFKDNNEWILGLELNSGKVVAMPTWYFREVEL